MELKITDKSIGGNIDYIYIGFGDKAEIYYDICDIDIRWEWYSGDWEQGCVYGRGYSFESLEGFALTNETFIVDGEECSEAEFLKTVGLSLEDFEAMGQEITKLVAREIEAEARRNPDNFLVA